MQQRKKLELDGYKDDELRLNSPSVKEKLEKAKKVQNQKSNVPSTLRLVSWKKRVAVKMSLVSKNFRNIELSNSDGKSTTTKKLTYAATTANEHCFFEIFCIGFWYHKTLKILIRLYIYFLILYDY